MGDLSEQWVQRADRVLAGGPATYSKHWSRLARGVSPVALTHGEGCYVWDVEGQRYLDTIAALGPILLGYRHPAVDAAVHAQVDRGASFSLMHPLEVEVAEQLCEIIPGCESVRFIKNGADATQAAVRLARAVTARRHVLCSGYHGGHDWYIGTTSQDAGLLPESTGYTHQLPWGDRLAWQETLRRYPREVAAVIVEVPPDPWGRDESRAFLHWLADQAHDAGGLFILDEVVTGFRYGLGGATEYYGLAPEVICLGKGLANGFPLAAVTGRRDLMAAFGQGVFCSTTFGGEAVSLAAAKATVRALRETEALATLLYEGHRLGQGLADRLEASGLPVQLRGNFARLILTWRDTPEATGAEWRTLWLQEMAQRGVLVGGPWFPMACYTEAQVTWLLDQAEAALAAVATARTAGQVRDRLRAAPAREVFERRYAEAR